MTDKELQDFATNLSDAIKKYKNAGGSQEYVVISRKDFERACKDYARGVALKARLKENKFVKSEIEELSDFAFVNYPEHELEKAIKHHWAWLDKRASELTERLGE